MKNLLKEYIHGDKFYDLSDFIFSDNLKQDYSVLNNKSGVIFCKTDYIHELFREISFSARKYILITHNSDHCISKELWLKKPSCIKVWFAQNVLFEHPNLIPIPIGMERPGIGHNGDISIIEGTIPIDRQDKKLALMGFNTSTNVKERAPIENHFCNVPWVTHIRNRVSFKEYINILRHYKYVLSPEGNGPDCIRTWEALYMDGVVPIVKRSTLTKYFNELPILLVDDFLRITPYMLNSSYEGIVNKEKNMVTMSYWSKLLQEKIKTFL